MNPRASAQLSDYISGRTTPDQTKSAIKSWSEFWCYTKAVEIHRMPFRPDKTRAFNALPDHIKERVKYYGNITKNKRR